MGQLYSFNYCLFNFWFILLRDCFQSSRCLSRYICLHHCSERAFSASKQVFTLSPIITVFICISGSSLYIPSNLIFFFLTFQISYFLQNLYANLEWWLCSYLIPRETAQTRANVVVRALGQRGNLRHHSSWPGVGLWPLTWNGVQKSGNNQKFVLWNMN